MKKLIIYPYDLKMQYFCEGNALLRDYSVCGLFSPSSWRKDSYTYDITPYSFFSIDSLRNKFSYFDSILVPDLDFENTEFRNEIIENLYQALQAHKEVLCGLKLNVDEKKALEKYAEKTRSIFTTYSWTPQNITIEPMKLQSIDKPLIYIGELCRGFYASELTTGLTNELKKRGYKVLTVLDQIFADLFDMKTTPSFIYTTEIPEQEKIIYLNAWLIEQAQIENPDIILVQVPGNTMHYNETLKDDFAVYQYFYSIAFRPDLFFMTIPLNFANENFFEKFSNTFEIRFGYEINGFYLSNIYIDEEAVRIKEKMDKTYVKPLYYYSIIKNIFENRIIYDCMCNQKYSKIADFIISFLST